MLRSDWSSDVCSSDLQPPNTHIQTTTTTSDSSRMSKWWPIGFLLAAITFFVIGGALIGTWGSGAYCYTDDNDDYYCYDHGNNSLLYGGAACCVIGGVSKITFWILLFVWCARRRRSMTTVVNVNTTPADRMAENKPSVNISSQQVPQPTYHYPQSSPPPPHAYTSVQNPGGMATPENQPIKVCGNCGTIVTTSTCVKCGGRFGLEA